MSRDPERSAGPPRPGERAPNDRGLYEVTQRDLPLYCPMDGMSLWNSHPRVYLPIEETGHAKCGYCGAEFKLVD
ncbi:MAG: zinc-finger domain-containing protein [Gammaproteobacteria bacterium]|nr:zinc-finger domain-containing protein [Gammaproteobacteria bacterium]